MVVPQGREHVAKRSLRNLTQYLVFHAPRQSRLHMSMSDFIAPGQSSVEERSLHLVLCIEYAQAADGPKDGNLDRKGNKTMNAATKQHNWARFISLFSEQNSMRPTRIGVFQGPPEAMEDFWLEDGIPLAGIDLDTHEQDAPDLEIMLGDGGKAGARHLTHVVEGVRFVKIILSASGNADGLEIEGRDGRTTILQFEEGGHPQA